jgi:hypothetical protein
VVGINILDLGFAQGEMAGEGTGKRNGKKNQVIGFAKSESDSLVE